MKPAAHVPIRRVTRRLAVAVLSVGALLQLVPEPEASAATTDVSMASAVAVMLAGDVAPGSGGDELPVLSTDVAPADAEPAT